MGQEQVGAGTNAVKSCLGPVRPFPRSEAIEVLQPRKRAGVLLQTQQHHKEVGLHQLLQPRRQRRMGRTSRALAVPHLPQRQQRSGGVPPRAAVEAASPVSALLVDMQWQQQLPRRCPWRIGSNPKPKSHRNLPIFRVLRQSRSLGCQLAQRRCLLGELGAKLVRQLGRPRRHSP